MKAMKLHKVFCSRRTLFSMMAALLFALPGFAGAEEIRSFASDIELERGGSFTVVETIEYDFGEAERHGIFRDIPKKHPQQASAWYKDRYIELELIAVEMDGEDVPYEADARTSELHIRIGDPDRTISGIHTYTITYAVTGGFSYFEDGAVELYWNVTGNDWEVPIGTVRARIADSSGLLLDTRACYIGTAGETNECPEISGSETEALFGAGPLAPYEGMTVAQALDGSAVATVILERMPTLWIWIILVLAWVIGLGFLAYRYETKHRTGRPIIAQYEPYEDFRPMYAGVLLDGRLDPHDITAGIVSLAEAGFLKIRKVGGRAFLIFEVDDYEITLLRPQSDVTTHAEREILALLFDEDAAPGTTMKFSDLKHDNSKRRENFTRLTALRSAIQKDLIEQDFFQNNYMWLVRAGGALALIAVPALFWGGIVALLALGAMLVSGIVILAFTYTRRTRKGYEALDYLKGFKQFLSVTDAERFSFHNAPAKSPEQFMQYLPFAIAFGVEKEWAEVFKDISIPNPSWYDGGQTAHFSALSLTQSLGGFSSSLTSAASVSPASSGGGSSGGGGGGGGGGSW